MRLPAPYYAGNHGAEADIDVVPALWLSPYWGVFSPPVLGVDLVAHASVIAPARPAGARKAFAQAHRVCAPTRAHTIKANMFWTYDLVFDTTASSQQIRCLTVGHQRVHPKMPGDRGGWGHPLPGGDRSTVQMHPQRPQPH